MQKEKENLGIERMRIVKEEENNTNLQVLR